MISTLRMHRFFYINKGVPYHFICRVLFDLFCLSMSSIYIPGCTITKMSLILIILSTNNHPVIIITPEFHFKFQFKTLGLRMEFIWFGWFEEAWYWICVEYNTWSSKLFPSTHGVLQYSCLWWRNCWIVETLGSHLSFHRKSKVSALTVMPSDINYHEKRTFSAGI